ncbi:hypothetical protein Nepgr_022591 [Nepenthes gracilis]|uniref:Uncharacterized protein n=1 Tax=Nepenthes gracilis TaxID=150966 RepID=A0AAD3T1A2_NEPGR|nr:hypothetical protein Nepgr_022591 [Nepenthes gracilis]
MPALPSRDPDPKTKYPSAESPSPLNKIKETAQSEADFGLYALPQTTASNKSSLQTLEPNPQFKLQIRILQIFGQRQDHRYPTRRLCTSIIEICNTQHLLVQTGTQTNAAHPVPYLSKTLPKHWSLEMLQHHTASRAGRHQ